jgi:hypothetical protein
MEACLCFVEYDFVTSNAVYLTVGHWWTLLLYGCKVPIGND